MACRDRDEPVEWSHVLYLDRHVRERLREHLPNSHPRLQIMVIGDDSDEVGLMRAAGYLVEARTRHTGACWGEQFIHDAHDAPGGESSADR